MTASSRRLQSGDDLTWSSEGSSGFRDKALERGFQPERSRAAMERALRCCLIATSVFGLLAAGGARADDRYDVARVSDQRGSLAVRGVEEDDYSYLERNSVLR